MQISVIIPAFNEEKRIEETLKAVTKLPYLEEIIVIDDGSCDETFSVAKKEGAKTIRLPRNKGKGFALNKGVEEAKGDGFLFLDADLGGTAKEAYKLLLPLLNQEADMTIAVFPQVKRKSGFGLVKGTARWGVRCLSGLDLKEPLSGQRALSREVLKAIIPFRSGYGVEVGATIKAAKAGFRILEVPTLMDHNVTGRDLKGFWHRGKQWYHVTRALFHTWKEN